MHYEKIINTLYSFGAAVVVIGAWGKIEHKEFSGMALTAGLLVEAGIFCVYGLMEWLRPPEDHPQQKHLESPGQENGREEVGELRSTLEETNRILKRVFK